jgi:transcription-repair coupling factor (superfamily II helicase)
MSLMGIRDISVISTPPEYRQSIITFVSAFDPAIITEAVRKEIARRGQIFFIHNRIETIENVARKLQQLVPEVRLGIAHGRMPEDRLEKVMLRFLNKEIDMLVCTTIVESGLDIPSANTILVNRADRFGLAQMYQLRGRVGRSDEQAYAYLFIPHESILTKEAQKRLKVLMEHSDLGSGFQIAMSDLQIRGGGAILGASQSGHIAAVGYEMFLQLMENAIAELKGEPVVETLSPEINLLLSAFIPETYIADIDQRLSAYRRLARMTELDEIAAFNSECRDRYGALPEEFENLMLKIMLKVMAIKAGVSRLDMNRSRLVLGFSEKHQKHPAGIVDMIMAEPKQFALTPDHTLKVRLAPGSAAGLVSQAKNILKRISHHVNN